GGVRPGDDVEARLRLEVEAPLRRVSGRGGHPRGVRGGLLGPGLPGFHRSEPVKRSLLRSYEGQIKVFLVLLVLFLAVAIFLNFHLLVKARDAIQREVGTRLALQADLVRAELERDQMLRGLRAPPGTVPYIPPTLLNLMARQKGILLIEILSLDGTVLSSSDAERVGTRDERLAVDPAAGRRLAAGGSVIAPLDRVRRSSYAT